MEKEKLFEKHFGECFDCQTNRMCAAGSELLKNVLDAETARLDVMDLPRLVKEIRRHCETVGYWDGLSDAGSGAYDSFSMMMAKRYLKLTDEVFDRKLAERR